ncbi:hypothetical protein ACFQ2B_21395 [Streptomyces stramineus]
MACLVYFLQQLLRHHDRVRRDLPVAVAAAHEEDGAADDRAHDHQGPDHDPDRLALALAPALRRHRRRVLARHPRLLPVGRLLAVRARLLRRAVRLLRGGAVGGRRGLLRVAVTGLARGAY